MERFPLFPTPSVTVSEITQYLRQVFESDDFLRDLWVQGEISNLSRPSSGHIYFTLKDSSSSLRCVIWKNSALRIRFDLQNGLAVEAHGAVSLYERDGTYQLYIDTMRPSGEGLLYQKFLRLKARLENEGLFDESRKRPLPERPRKIGIVTSQTGAALQDILNTLRRRSPLVQVIISPASVQGEEAPREICAAIERINLLAKVDVIILGRGGGSLEDLWAFNDEQVVRAVHASTAPVITGIGHETDFTLADFAADRRAPTPTAAAEMAAPDKNIYLREVEDLEAAMAEALMSEVDNRRYRLADLTRILRQSSPIHQIRSCRQQLDDLVTLAYRALRHELQVLSIELNGEASRLAALNPQSILERGYAIVSKMDGSPVRYIAQITAGDAVRTRLADGQFTARVENK